MLTAQILPRAPGSSSYEAWTGSLPPSPPRSPRVLLLGSEGGGKLREPLSTCEPLTPLHPAPELESCRGAGLTDLLRVRPVLVGRGFCPNSVSLPHRSRGVRGAPGPCAPGGPTHWSSLGWGGDDEAERAGRGRDGSSSCGGGGPARAAGNPEGVGKGGHSSRDKGRQAAEAAYRLGSYT